MNFKRGLTAVASDEPLSTRQILGLVGLAALVTLGLTLVPGLELLNYSFRLLITMVHELGHGLAALLTGGRFIRFVIFPDGSGVAYTAGGWRFVVIPAGYLGAALFGAVLILLGRSYRWGRLAMAVIGCTMLLLGLRYGLPTIFAGQLGGGLLTTVSGIIFGLAFLFVAVKASPRWIIFLLHVIAIQAGMTAFGDITTVIGLSTNLFGAQRSDAQSMAELTFIPALVWALLWAIAALILVGGAIWLTWISPLMRQDQNDRVRSPNHYQSPS